MAKLNGHGGTATFNSVVYEANKWSATIDIPELDVTDSGSSDWQELIIGTKKVSGNFSFFVDAETLSALIGGTAATLSLKIGKSNVNVSGSAFITAVAIDNTVGSPVAVTCNFSSTGPWTIA